MKVWLPAFAGMYFNKEEVVWLNILKVGFDLDDFCVRLSKVEENVKVIECESTKEKLGEIKSYDYLVRTEKCIWDQHGVIKKLSDELFAIRSEIRTEGMRVSGEKLDSLSKRVSDALMALSEVIQRLSEQKDTLYKELVASSRTYYENWINALPGDSDEGC